MRTTTFRIILCVCLMALAVTLVPGLFYLVPLSGGQWLTQLGLACAAARS